MALSTARIHRVRGRPPLLAVGIKSLIHSHSSSVRSLGDVFFFIHPCYTTHEDFSDRLLEYRNHGRLPAVKQQMVDMALNGRGIRDTARVLRGSPTTVISTLKKKIQAYSK